MSRADPSIIMGKYLIHYKEKSIKDLTPFHERVPVVEVPRKIRFGLSRGSVYELKKPNTTAREYIGFCINLASRLQSYCPALGFIASAQLMIPDSVLEEYGYQKTVATQIKGFPDELVIVDIDEYEDLPDELRDDLFKEPE